MAWGVLTHWQVSNEPTGRTTNVSLVQGPKRRGPKPSLKSGHKHVVGLIRRPAARGSVRLAIGGVETEVAARRASVPFWERVERRQVLLQKRGHPLAAEAQPPTGQAALWYGDAIQCVPPSGARVARQLARLCKEDSQVCLPIDSLANAVGHRDRAGHEVAYTQRGITCLVEAGWLQVETVGAGRGARTTFYLMPGDPSSDWFPEDDAEWQHQRL